MLALGNPFAVNCHPSSRSIRSITLITVRSMHVKNCCLVIW
jgi:hypothetical protein